MKVKLQNITKKAEANIVEIARVSSTRENKKENLPGLINYLIAHEHWSPFEHAYMTVEIETSKAIGIQLIRHRSFTFQEFSQRYAEVTKIELIELRKQAESNRQSSTRRCNPLIQGNFNGPYDEAKRLIKDHLGQSKFLYNRLIKAGVAKECARMVLPMATSTTIYMTGSIRSWIHFLKIRDDEHAQLEIQKIAKKIKKIFVKKLPIISKALKYI